MKKNFGEEIGEHQFRKFEHLEVIIHEKK